MRKRGKDPLDTKIEKLSGKIWKFLHRLWQELRIDGISMINWLLFYKPKDKMDKAIHIFEIVFVWVVVSKVFFG